MRAEEYLNDKLDGAHQKHTEDGVMLHGILHIEMCIIMEEYYEMRVKENELLHSVSNSNCPCYCDMWNTPDVNGDIYCSCGKKV